MFSFLLLITAHASLGQSKAYSFVFLHKKPDVEDVDKDVVEKIMQGHMANMERLAKEGKLLAAGPFEGGGGIFILNTTSIDEAEQWLSTDPGVQAKRWNIEILPYHPTIGNVCSANEPYEMVMYNFVRFKISSGQNALEILKENQKFIQGLDSLVTAGDFGSNGSIVISRGHGNQEDTASNPTIKKGTMTAERKKLWIAKGSFCEQ
jgi:uncharacterized protein YciI